jgi:hypothetical protein
MSAGAFIDLGRKGKEVGNFIIFATDNNFIDLVLKRSPLSNLILPFDLTQYHVNF